ncbi:MAG: GNAT family N-acetyltransferase, partial [Chthoniobacterales bacterium]
MTMRDVLVELMKPEDWPAVREIYRAGLDTGQASFETDVPDWEKWDAKYLAPFRLVARDDNG